jgi:putative tricarboxylic transport membrane protein
VSIPLSGILLGIAAALLVIALLPSVRKGRDEVFVE